MAVRVLMVEDDASIASMYRLRLRAAGFEVEIAPTGEEGVERALAAPPDVVLLDIMLPGIDGIEVLRRIRADERAASLRVIVLSNSAGLPGAAEEARRLGIEAWLVKSRTSPTQLVERLATISDDQPSH